LDIEVTEHGASRLSERGIGLEEVEGILKNADQVVEGDEEAQIAQKVVERGGEDLLLRAVYVEEDKGLKLITAYLTSKIREVHGEKGMKASYDEEEDALYIKLREGEYQESEEAREGVILDFDGGGNLLGIEVLQASSKLTQDELTSVGLEITRKGKAGAV